MGSMKDGHFGRDLRVKALELGKHPGFPETVLLRKKETVVNTERRHVQESGRSNAPGFPAELMITSATRVVENDDSHQIGK